MDNPIKITMYTDIICPWCYLGMATLDHLSEKYNLEIEHIGVEIHPETPAEGRPLDWSNEMLDKTMDVINQRLSAYGLKLPKSAPVVANTHDALLVLEYARTVGKADAYIRRMWDAYLLRGANVGLKPVLYEEAEKAGISVNEVNRALRNPLFAGNLESEKERYNVTSVPTFILGGKYLINGAHEEEVFEECFQKLLTSSDFH